jgi:hypothetical protein
VRSSQAELRPVLFSSLAYLRAVPGGVSIAVREWGGLGCRNALAGACVLSGTSMAVFEDCGYSACEAGGSESVTEDRHYALYPSASRPHRPGLPAAGPHRLRFGLWSGARVARLRFLARSRTWPTKSAGRSRGRSVSKPPLNKPPRPCSRSRVRIAGRPAMVRSPTAIGRPETARSPCPRPGMTARVVARPFPLPQPTWATAEASAVQPPDRRLPGACRGGRVVR